jgi:histidine triad (HIT) family protein
MSRLLYQFAKTGLGGLILGWVFAYFSFAIPSERLAETDSLIAFHHPSPSYPLHILIVPKGKYKSILDLPPNDPTFLIDLFSVVKNLVQRFNLESKSYRMVVNGGEVQEVNHLHFHLFSDEVVD